MKILKYLGLALGAVLALVLVLVGTVALLFDPNDYKSELQRAVAQRTGRSLMLAGDLRLAWFPWLAVEFGPASLGNAPGFGREPLLEIERARLGLRLTSLLRLRFDFDTVRLDRPVLRLAVDGQGRDNWSGISDAAEGSSSNPRPGAAIDQATFSALHIEGGRLEYRDARDATQLELSDVVLETGRLQGSAPFDLETSFDWRAEPDSSIGVALEARATLDPRSGRHRLERPRIALRLFGASMPERGIPVNLAGGPIEIDLEAQALRMPRLELESLGARLSGELTGSGILDAPQFDGVLRLATMSPREWLRGAGIAVPPMRDPASLTRLSFEGRLQATADAFSLEDLALQFDGATGTGSAGIADLERDAFRFDLAFDRFDFDHYLPPAVEAAPEAARSAGAATAPVSAASKEAVVASGKPPELPVDLLRGLDLAGQLVVRRAGIAGLPLTDLRLGVYAQQSKLRLFPLEAALYDGRYRGDLRVDVSGEVPRIDFDEKLTDVDFAPLLRDLMDSKRIAGRGSGSIAGVARGRDLDALRRSVDGKVRLQVADGAIEGADLWFEIRRARALLRREPAPTRPPGAPRTPFTRLEATGRLGNGQLRSDDVAMEMQYLRVAGRGGIDLVARTVDWNLDAKVLKIPDDDAAMQEVVDFTIPVKVTGPLASPDVRPDLAGLAKARVREEIEKRRGDVEQKVRDKLRDLLGR